MSGLSFRPRPIDISKPIPIIRADSEDYEEIIKLAVTVPKIATGMDPEDEEEKHIQEAIKRSLHAQANPSDYAIPTPTFNIVEEPEVPPFDRKASYIQFHIPTQEELDAQVEYDLGESDCEWLEQYNQELKGGRRLSEDGLEFMIDRMEKALCYSKTQALTQVQAEKVLADDSVRKVPLAHVGPVYKHWMKKRKGRKQPLLERFHEPPAFDDPSPLVAFRPREPFSKHHKKGGSRKNDKIAYNKMTQLRREFERSRMLLEMIKKREKLKRDQIQLAFELFELRVKEGVPLTDDPRELEREQKERERERDRALLLASAPSTLASAYSLKTERSAAEHPRKRRRRDSALTASSSSRLAGPSSSSSSSSTSSSTSTSSAPSPGLISERGRPPSLTKRPKKALLMLTHGHTFPADFKPTRGAVPDFMMFGPVATLSSAQQATQAAAAAREREAYAAHLNEVMHQPPPVPYPMEQAGRVFVGPALPPFRGRVRLGRGGRILFDRFPSRPSPPSSPFADEGEGREIAHSITATSAHHPPTPSWPTPQPSIRDSRQSPQCAALGKPVQVLDHALRVKSPSLTRGASSEQIPSLEEVDLEFEVACAFQALERDNAGGDQHSLIAPCTATASTWQASEQHSHSEYDTALTVSHEEDFSVRLARIFGKWRGEEENLRRVENQRLSDLCPSTMNATCGQTDVNTEVGSNQQTTRLWLCADNESSNPPTTSWSTEPGRESATIR